MCSNCGLAEIFKIKKMAFKKYKHIYLEFLQIYVNLLKNGTEISSSGCVKVYF